MEPDDREDSKSQGLLLWYLIVAGMIAIASTVALNSIFGGAGIRGISAVSSVILSTALVLLYHRQSTIQYDQYQIMEQQKKIMKAEVTPHIVVENSEPVNNDYMEIILSNFGKGLAKNIRLIVDVYSESVDKDRYQHFPESCRRRTEDGKLRGGDSLPPRSEWIKFGAEAKLEDTDTGEVMPLRDVISREMINDGDWEGECYVQFFIECEDQSGNKYLSEVLPKGQCLKYTSPGYHGGTSLVGLKRNHSQINKKKQAPDEWPELSESDRNHSFGEYANP